MRAALPPIFAKYRLVLPEVLRPHVVFVVTPEMDDEATELVRSLDKKDAVAEHYGCWWVEHGNLGILARMRSKNVVALHGFGKRSGAQTPFAFDTRALSDEKWDDLEGWQKLTAACYVRAAILFHEYTRREAEVSVNTRTRNSPRVLVRQGDTVRYAPATSLASAAGQARQRGYEPPAEPSGIRMREHDVRGHWRHYASGVRVWVRAHKRGDAELGRVTRVVQ